MEGVATSEQIDMIFIKEFHHEMGSLYTTDLIIIISTIKNIKQERKKT